MKKTEFTDAMQVEKENPDTFQLPTIGEIETIKEGTYLKVCADPERFWVKVTSVNKNGTCSATVEQTDMVCTEEHGYSHGDEVTVQVQNIYAVYNVEGDLPDIKENIRAVHNGCNHSETKD